MNELRVLDYGCGNGEFVKYLKGQGIIAAGYDPSVSQYASQQSGPFDAVILTEVIGQLDRPAAILAEIKKQLFPKGLLLIEGFFIDSIREDTWPTAPEVTAQYGARFIPTFKGIVALMEANGFTLKKAFNRNVFAFQKK